MILRIVGWLEVLGGARPVPLSSPWRAAALGVWWAFLLILVYLTIGRATKFIYVDF
jgi:hypothetical protein